MDFEKHIHDKPKKGMKYICVSNETDSLGITINEFEETDNFENNPFKHKIREDIKRRIL